MNVGHSVTSQNYIYNNERTQRNNKLIKNTAITAGTGAAIGAAVIRPVLAEAAKVPAAFKCSTTSLLQEGIKNAGGSQEAGKASSALIQKFLSPKAYKDLEKVYSPEGMTKFFKDIEKKDANKMFSNIIKKGKTLNKKLLIPSMAIGSIGALAVASTLSSVKNCAKALSENMSANKN